VGGDRGDSSSLYSSMMMMMILAYLFFIHSAFFSDAQEVVALEMPEMHDTKFVFKYE
jgi:hypothetical protein